MSIAWGWEWAYSLSEIHHFHGQGFVQQCSNLNETISYCSLRIPENAILGFIAGGSIWLKGNTAKVTFSLTKGVLTAYCILVTRQGAEDENPKWIIPNKPDYLRM